MPTVSVATWLKDIRDNPGLAVRSAAVGWIALWVLWGVVAPWLVRFDDWLFVRGVADIRDFWPDPRAPFFHFLIGGGFNAAVGWFVGRVARDHQTPMVLLFFVSVLVISDLPRFVPAALAALGPGHGRFWGIVVLDFVFLRLPIVAAGIGGVGGRRALASLKKRRGSQRCPTGA